MPKMDWSKAKKFKETEEKYTDGAVLRSGRTVKKTPRDSLDARAKAAEKRWLKNNPRIKGL